MRKYEITDTELPPVMQDYLRSQTLTPAGVKHRTASISSALRGLIVTARQAGLAEKLSLATGSLFIQRLRTEGWTTSSIVNVECILRRYAYATDEGLDWALSSSRVDRRPLDCVYRGRHWAPYRPLMETLSAAVPAVKIRLLDRWLRHRTRYAQCNETVVDAFQATASDLKTLAGLMTSIDPDALDTRYLQQAQRTVNSVKLDPEEKRRRRPAKALPEPFASQLQKIASVELISVARQKAMASALRRLIKACEANGIPIVLTMQSAQLFVEGLFESDMKNISRAGYCDFLACFAKHAGYPKDLHRELMAVQNALKLESHQDFKKKAVKLAHTPIALADIAALAFRLREAAGEHHHLRMRWRDYTLSAVLALLSKVPLRTLDLRHARVGHEFTRDSEGWSCNIVTSKTGTTMRGRLAPELTPYLDTALLCETSERHLWTIYEARQGTALFGNPASDWAPFSHDWLRRNMDQHLGHSPHIVRTLIHDEIPRDASLDLSVAQALCGHAHETSRRAYEVNAPARRREASLGQLNRIQQQLESAAD